MSNRNLFLTLTVASLFLRPVFFVHAADHLDAPLVAEDGRHDVNDIFAFQSPTNANNTELDSSRKTTCDKGRSKCKDS